MSIEGQQVFKEVAPQSVPKDSSAPKTLHCLVCRTLQPVSDLKLVEQSFVSKKNGKTMMRSSWKGTCDVCGKKVNQFAKRS